MIQKRLRHTNNTKPVMNDQEEYYVKGWEIIDKEVTRLLDESWSLQEHGRDKYALAKNYAANYYIFLFYYAYFIKQDIERQTVNANECLSTYIDLNYKICCVEKNLPCLSSTYGVDYVSVWKKLTEAFGISRQAVECNTGCCLGISEMVINSNDDCIAFIIGPCDVNDDLIGEGEYEDCTYDDGHNHGEFPETCEQNTLNCN